MTLNIQIQYPKVKMQPDSVKKLFLVNYAPPSTSIYLYSSNIHNCTYGYSEQINLQYSNRSKKWNHDNQDINFRSPIKNLLSANIMLSRLLFRKAKKYIFNSMPSNGVVHYTHQNVSPFTLDLENSVVSIHDNPFTSLKYGIYNSANGKFVDKMMFQLYSQSVRHNFAQYKKFRYVITTSDYVKKSLVKYGYRNEITTIHPPVGQSFFPIADKDRLRKELNLPIEKILLLSVSTDQPRKNLKLIEYLMKRLDQNYQIVRVGKPILNSINYSNVDSITLNKIYNACDLLVIPSTEEGYGSPIPEAMAVGTPVVCSNIEVFHELCLNAAAYFDPHSIEDLEMAVRNVTENHKEYAELALKRSAEFTFSKFCSEINSYYNQRFFK